MKYFLIFFLFYSYQSSALDCATKKCAIYGTYSYFDTWLPSKIGVLGSYGDADRTYEFAFQTASYSFDFLIDGLGGVTDQRIHLSTRSFIWSKTFNIQYGVYYNSIQAKLGNLYTDLIGASVDLIEVKTLGVLWGLGNRWTFENGFSVGADWLKIFWPLHNLKTSDQLKNFPSSSEKDDLKTFIDTVAKIPTFSVLHFEIGYKF